MLATRLLLIRHGEAWHSLHGIVGGPRGDGGLTERGREQARRLRDRLARSADLAGAALYSSTLPRAIETATIIAPALGAAAPTQHCGLCTYHYPAAGDGMTGEEFRRVLGRPGGGVYRAYEEGNESWAQLLVRVGAAIFEIAIANAGRTAVLVTHTEALQASLTALGELPSRRHFDLAIANAAITEWLTEDDPAGGGPPAWAFARWRLVRLNDAAHLETMLP